MGALHAQPARVVGWRPRVGRGRRPSGVGVLTEKPQTMIEKLKGLIGKLRKKDGDERAVSPVIGVILMVAITVILAAVIGTFVLDLGQSAGQSAPQASFSVSTDAPSGNITIDHTGGDVLQTDQVNVIIRNDSGTVRWTEANTRQAFAAGDQAEFNVTVNSSEGTGVEGMNLVLDADGLKDQGALVKNTEYEVIIIDTESGNQIFSTTVTA